MDDGRTSGHVPAVRIDLLDQKVKKVTHLNVAVPEESRVVIPELDVVLRHFPRLAAVFEAERADLELLLVGDHLLQLSRFARLRRLQLRRKILLNVVDDGLKWIFGDARHRNTSRAVGTLLAQDERYRLVDGIGPILSTFVHTRRTTLHEVSALLHAFNALLYALGEIEDPSRFGLPYLRPVCMWNHKTIGCNAQKETCARETE